MNTLWNIQLLPLHSSKGPVFNNSTKANDDKLWEARWWVSGLDNCCILLHGLLPTGWIQVFKFLLSGWLAIWLQLLSPLPSWSLYLKDFFLPSRCYDIKEDFPKNIGCIVDMLYLFVFKCKFQGLFWPPLACNCWSLQSWSRWGCSHILLHDLFTLRIFFLPSRCHDKEDLPKNCIVDTLYLSICF